MSNHLLTQEEMKWLRNLFSKKEEKETKADNPFSYYQEAQEWWAGLSNSEKEIWADKPDSVTKHQILNFYYTTFAREARKKK